MTETVVATTIARPPEVVWAALARFDGISRWAPNVEHSCLTTEQAEGIGAVRRVQVGRNALLERIVEWEPDRRLSYTIEGLPPVVRSVTNTWTLEEAGGSTAVALSSRVEAGPRPPQRLVARVFGRVLGRVSRTMVDGLQTHLEEVEG